MHDPVSTPDGYLFERAALEDLGCKIAVGLHFLRFEDWTSQHGSNPLTGAPLVRTPCSPGCELASFCFPRPWMRWWIEKI